MDRTVNPLGKVGVEGFGLSGCDADSGTGLWILGLGFREGVFTLSPKP